MKLSLRIKVLLNALILSFLIPIVAIPQVNWTKHEDNPVLDSGSVSWANIVSCPVVIFEDQVFKMWFAGGETMNDYFAIGYAESIDGIYWVANDEPVIYPGYQGVWDEERFPGCIIRVNDTLKLWYSGTEYMENKYSIGYGYYSEDSAKWILRDDPVMEKGETGDWDADFVLGPSVHYDGLKYHMWYSGRAGPSSSYPTLIGHATSWNGISWEKDTLNNPVISLGPNGYFYDSYAYGPTVLYHDNEYHMWFAGWDGYSTSPFRYVRIGYATSSNGVDWDIQNDEEPVLDVGEPGDWDDRWVRYSSVLIHENQFKMWFDGRGENVNIGFALDGFINPVCSEKGISSKFNLFPNPCKSFTKISLTLPSTSYLTIDLYTVTGHKIRRLMNEEKKAGTHELKLDLNDLSAGMYLLHIESNNIIRDQKIIKH